MLNCVKYFERILSLGQVALYKISQTHVSRISRTNEAVRGDLKTDECAKYFDVCVKILVVERHFYKMQSSNTEILSSGRT